MILSGFSFLIAIASVGGLCIAIKTATKTTAQKKVQTAIPETEAEHFGEAKIPVEDGVSLPLENKNDTN